MALVTIVIPTISERSELLQEAIASVLAQTEQVELLVAPDFEYEGPAAARNKALKAVVTPWVGFCDDDDWLYPTYVERLLEHFETADVVYSWCNADHANFCRPFNAEELRLFPYIPNCLIVRTELARAVGGYPTEGCTYEDWAFQKRLLEAGARFHCIEEPLWEYRLRDDSRTHTNDQLVRDGATP